MGLLLFNLIAFFWCLFGAIVAHQREHHGLFVLNSVLAAINFALVVVAFL